MLQIQAVCRNELTLGLVWLRLPTLTEGCCPLTQTHRLHRRVPLRTSRQSRRRRALRRRHLPGRRPRCMCRPHRHVRPSSPTHRASTCLMLPKRSIMLPICMHCCHVSKRFQISGCCSTRSGCSGSRTSPEDRLCRPTVLPRARGNSGTMLRTGEMHARRDHQGGLLLCASTPVARCRSVLSDEQAPLHPSKKSWVSCDRLPFCECRQRDQRDHNRVDDQCSIHFRRRLTILRSCDCYLQSC